LAHPTQEVVSLARQFVCVRVVDMREVDLAHWRFDFDLTFAAMTAAADGTVLHRYGGRDASDAQSALSMESLAAFLSASLGETRGRPDSAPSPQRPAHRTIRDLPLFRARDDAQRVECVHCHTVNDFEFRQAQHDGTWRREQIWHCPDPARIGLEVERDDPRRVATVAAGGPAAAAGVRVGDRLLRAGGAALASRADLQWVLDGLPFTATALPLELEREGRPFALSLALADGWKAADPLEYSWRPMKWNLSPQPGFGGKLLEAAEKRKLGLAEDAFALRVNYLVTWGEQERFGRNAERAGLRQGSIVVSIDGRTDFVNEAHFQAWFRLEKHPGDVVELALLEEGRRRTIRLPVIE
jgi:hypothetical protein